MQAAYEPADILSQLERWGAARDWVGPDPYEGLNSPLGRVAVGRWGRQAVIQAYKRLPFSPPWPLHATPRPNSKALALALSGYAAPAGGRLRGAGVYLDRLPRALGRMSLMSAPRAAWGYPFDAQTRHLFYDRSTPNAVATCFVVGALLDAYAATGKAPPLDLALRARSYLASLLAWTSDRQPFFAYVADGSELIHNANVLVAAGLARLHEIDPDESTGDVARSAVETTLGLQRSDGLWPYGERADLEWRDNFHTAYIIESLAHVDRVYGLGREQRESALSAWADRFFGSDGRARYYPDRDYPLEAHSYASAIDCLCASGSHGDRRWALDRATDVAHSAVQQLWLARKGCFASKRTSRHINRRIFMRWTNAPMFRALSRLVSQLAVKSPKVA
jgi:hypothetical protein